MKIVIENGTIQKINGQNPATLFYDKKEKKVWANVYASENEWTEYHDENIMALTLSHPYMPDFEPTKLTRKSILEIVKMNLEMLEIEHQHDAECGAYYNN